MKLNSGSLVIPDRWAAKFFPNLSCLKSSRGHEAANRHLYYGKVDVVEVRSRLPEDLRTKQNFQSLVAQVAVAECYHVMKKCHPAGKHAA